MFASPFNFFATNGDLMDGIVTIGDPFFWTEDVEQFIFCSVVEFQQQKLVLSTRQGFLGQLLVEY